MEYFSILANGIEGRIDPHFYRPEFIELEKKVLKKTNKKLGDFIETLSGGATPSRKKDNELYTDKDNGIPFLRVQNITEKGLKLEGIKFITKEVHNVSLKRSQVSEGDLLITITGRIASSCVVPNGFIGNINQHSVVIKTKNRETSELVASFLNSRVGHKLALRRTSGGSRPALDYKALKSIPIIIEEKIVQLMDKAYSLKKSHEAKAKQLLDSINDYVLDELGIKLPGLKDKMCYLVYADEIQGRRIDPKKYTKRPKAILKAIRESKYKTKKLKNILSDQISGEWGEDPYSELKSSNDYIIFKVIRNTNFVNNANLDLTDIAERLINKNKLNKNTLKKGDLLIEKSGGSPIQPVGRVALIEDTKENYTFSNFLQRFRVKKDECLSKYLFAYLKAIYSLGYMEYLQNQTTGIKNLIIEEYLLIPVPLPPFTVQNKIAEEVKSRMQKAGQLQKEAKEELEKAKQEVEKIIFERG